MYAILRSKRRTRKKRELVHQNIIVPLFVDLTFWLLFLFLLKSSSCRGTVKEILPPVWERPLEDSQYGSRAYTATREMAWN
jgi:biopolymer transport protein ExbD